MDCAFCDAMAHRKDKDLGMWLCRIHWIEMNSVAEMELEEVF